MAKNKILLGTNNTAKIRKWTTYLPELTIVTPREIGLVLEVEEDMHSLIHNSQKKALAFAQASGLLTLSDDGGFYIHALNGLPGVAVRRWAGQLPDNVTDQAWLEFLKQQLQGIEDLRAYFELAISVATPQGRVETVSQKKPGRIDRVRLDTIITQEIRGTPLGYCFIRDNQTKPSEEMNPEERRAQDVEIIGQVAQLIQKMQRKKD